MYKAYSKLVASHYAVVLSPHFDILNLLSAQLNLMQQLGSGVLGGLPSFSTEHALSIYFTLLPPSSYSTGTKFTAVCPLKIGFRLCFTIKSSSTAFFDTSQLLYAPQHLKSCSCRPSKDQELCTPRFFLFIPTDIWIIRAHHAL